MQTKDCQQLLLALITLPFLKRHRHQLQRQMFGEVHKWQLQQLKKRQLSLRELVGMRLLAA